MASSCADNGRGFPKVLVMQHNGRSDGRRSTNRTRESLLSRFGYSFDLIDILLVAGLMLFILLLVLWLPVALR